MFPLLRLQTVLTKILREKKIYNYSIKKNISHVKKIRLEETKISNPHKLEFKKRKKINAEKIWNKNTFYLGSKSGC